MWYVLSVLLSFTGIGLLLEAGIPFSAVVGVTLIVGGGLLWMEAS